MALNRKIPACGAGIFSLKLFCLVFRRKFTWAFVQFLESELGVVCRHEPLSVEKAACLCGWDTCELGVALFFEALLDLGDFGVRLEFVSTAAFVQVSALACALVDSPEGAATVECSDAAARNHDVELVALYIVPDVGNHDDQLLADQCLCTCVGRVLAVAVKGEQEARSAGMFILATRTGCKCIGEIVVNDNGSLVCTDACLAAVTDALDIVVALLHGLSLRVAGSCDGAAFAFPGAVRFAAIPIT